MKIPKNTVGLIRYKKFGNKYLVTNMIGRYVFLTPTEFKKFIAGKLNKKTDLYAKLQTKGFINQDIDELINQYRQRKVFLFQGPSLHIVVVTLRCNYKCVYCQASSRDMTRKGFDMDKETAKKTVDVIFKSPSQQITIEFQGGEPLVNWPVVKFITEYAEKKNKKAEKELLITLVSNFSLMTDEKLNFLKKHHIALCTSLDGPEDLHNKNRPYPGGNSYKSTTQWIKKIKEEEKKDKNLYKVNALLTVSRYSLKYHREIIDEYLKLGFTGIHLRPLSNLGLSNKFKEQIGYSAEDFMKYWEKSLDYIIGINLKGKLFFERGTALMLRKILTDQDPNFLELRSPCGAGIGQMLYNYDGKVYTCDEARMLGEDTFLLGNVKDNSYKELVASPNIRAVCQASLLDNLACDNCVYKPYCGVCPVLNYALYGDLFPPATDDYVCKLHQGMLDYIFKKLQNEKVEKVFQKWIGLKK